MCIRLIPVFLIISLHLGIGLFLNIPQFQVISIVALIPFVPFREILDIVKEKHQKPTHSPAVTTHSPSQGVPPKSRYSILFFIELFLFAYMVLHFTCVDGGICKMPDQGNFGQLIKFHQGKHTHI